MKENKKGVIAPIRGDKYQLMIEWIRIFRSSSEKKYIYGAGNRGKEILKWLREEKIEIDAFIDNNQRLQGNEIDGLEVLPASIIFNRRCKIIVSPYRSQDIINSLKNE